MTQSRGVRKHEPWLGEYSDSEQSFSSRIAQSKDLSLTEVRGWKFSVSVLNQVVMVLTIRASYPLGREVSMTAVINLAKWN